MISELIDRLLGLTCRCVAHIVELGDSISHFLAALHLSKALEVMLKVLGLNALANALLLPFDALLRSVSHTSQIRVETHLRYRTKRAVRSPVRLRSLLLIDFLALNLNVGQTLRVDELDCFVPYNCRIALVIDIDIIQAEIV